MSENNNIRKPSLGVALIPILCLIIFIAVTIFKFDQSPHIPLILGSIVAIIVSLKLGHKWEQIEKDFIQSIINSMQAIIILMIIGLLIGSWILSGTVPAMIFYGLKILNPGIFLAVSCIMCSVVSIATGSSWTTAGTIGVALIGIGQGLGIPAPLVAGSIISGAYFGDKMSPLSDTTNLAPAMSGATLFDHIRHMVYTTGPSLLLALILFVIFGLKYAGQELDQGQISEILSALQSSFSINIFLLIPPILVILMVVFKVPAIPGLIGGVLLGGVFTFIFQMGHLGGFMGTLESFLGVINDGYVADTGNEMVNELLTNGGLQSMMWTISLIICAMVFGGIMEKNGCLETIANFLLGLAKNTGSLVTVTILSCIFINIIAGDQYLAIVIPGRMYKNEYRKRGLAPKNLSRCLEDSGTLTSPLVPWNTCGAFMSKALGVATIQYLPYCFLNLINPIVSIILGFTGITMEKLKPEDMEAAIEA